MSVFSGVVVEVRAAAVGVSQANDTRGLDVLAALLLRVLLRVARMFSSESSDYC